MRDDTLPALAVGCLALCWGVVGCALRATTDFGPGDEPSRQSVGAGVGPFHDLLNSDRQGLGVGNEPASDGIGTSAGGGR